MPYEVPRSKRSLKQNQFEFTVPNDPTPDRVYTIPLPQFIKPSLLSSAPTDAMFQMIQDLFPGSNLPLEARLKLEQEHTAALEQQLREVDLEPVKRSVPKPTPGVLEMFEGLDQLMALIDAWQKAGQLDLGESKDSLSTSPTTPAQSDTSSSASATPSTSSSLES